MNSMPAHSIFYLRTRGLGRGRLLVAGIVGVIGRKDLKQVLAGEIGRREGVIAEEIGPKRRVLEKDLGAVEDF